MATFTFTATDPQGQTLSGVRSAATRQELIAKLRAENLVVTSVQEDPTSAKKGEPSGSALLDSLLLGQVRNQDLMVMTRQLAAMLKAGISLSDGLQVLAQGTRNERFRRALQEVRQDVQRGRTLTEAMRKHPYAFDQLFISMIHAGESSGSLAQNVARLSEYLKRKENFRRKLKSATAYPKFVFGFFLLLTSGIFLVLIPRFKSLFEDFHAKLPPLTEFFLNLSTFLRSNIVYLLMGAVGLVVAAVALKRTRRGAEIFDRLILKVPLFGALFLKAAVARLAMTLSTLIGNGIPLTDALQIATTTLNNAVLEEGLRAARHDVVQGRTLAESLARIPELPRLLPRMVRVGEESGTLSGMLEDVAEFYDQEVDHTLGRITSLVEPVLICGMGLVVLVTVISVYLPIFTLGRTIRGGG